VALNEEFYQMALGTITIVKQAAAHGPLFHDRISFAGDGAYPTGGTAAFETTFRSKIGSSRTIVAIIPDDCGVYLPSYDIANKKLKVKGIADGAEVSNATDLSGTTFNLTVISE
jgi:hypothetical protein